MTSMSTAATNNTIHIARQFSEEPYGRTQDHGDDNGERFRHQWLLPALSRGQRILIEMDGAVGYGSSFLEEAFGGLVRLGYYNKDQLREKLTVHHKLSRNVDLVWHYIDRATFGVDKGKREAAEKRWAARH